MPADLSREEIERIRDGHAGVGWMPSHEVDALLRHVLSEPARIEAARQEGYREGIEDAKQAAGCAAWRHEGDDARSQGMDAGARHQVAECVKAIAALSPAPAEPSAPVAEGE